MVRVSTHWLPCCTALVGGFVGLPFLAPAFMALGLANVGTAIYRLYWPFCHQFAYRSWFLFGKQPYYLTPQFETLTGLDPYSIAGRWAAKNFHGNAIMGWKVALCERDVAIYVGVLMGGLVYGFVRSRGIRVQPVSWLVFGLVGVAPIGLDGFSQLLSQPPYILAVLPFRESTPLLRSVTGVLFGAMNVWLAYPYVDEWMAELRG